MIPSTRLKAFSTILLVFAFLVQSCMEDDSHVFSSATPTVTINMTSAATNFPQMTSTPSFTPPPKTIPTSVSPGIFPLLAYPPLIMNYDTSEWRLVNIGSLQALSLETCQIVEIGPSGNFPPDTEPARLGDIEYLFSFSEISTPGMTAGLYIENQSVDGYDYDLGLPVLMITASKSEWNQCKNLGEAVLSTLRVP
jgi:hypothetical protein